MEHGGHADRCTEVLGVGRDGGECLRCRGEQQAIDLGLVLVGDGADRGWQREHHMEVGDWQQLRGARLKPVGSGSPLTLRAMTIAARVVGDASVRAILATLDMPAKRGGTASLESPS